MPDLFKQSAARDEDSSEEAGASEGEQGAGDVMLGAVN